MFIETGHQTNVVRLPAPFIRWRENQPGAFVNDHGRARWRAVTLGLRRLQNVEVTQGLSVGGQVVRPRRGPETTAL